jgi:hypothetical protein
VDREFRPLLRNPHLLTIAGNFWPREIDERRFPPTRNIYDTGPGTKILVVEHQPQRPPKGQILFLHGLEGSSEAGYIKSFAQEALIRGFGVHRSNMRTCGSTEALSETMYHSGLTSDTLLIAKELRERFGDPVILVGFSLGGNVALKLAGELGDTDLIAGVCAISTPIDLAACVRMLDRPGNRLYAWRFLNRLKRRVREKALVSPHLYSTEGLDAIKSIWEFDDRYTGPLFGFGNAENYYATQSAQRFLDAIRAPTLVIQAKDDPMIPFPVFSHPAFERNPALHLLAVEGGGHLGFLSRRKPRFWLDGIALDWIQRQLGTLDAAMDAIHGTKQDAIASA